jgi:glycosyltransferase involved in cell wall biosynthesis
VYSWLFSLAAFLLLRQGQYDIFHIHQALYPAALSVAVAKLFGKQTVVKVAGGGESGNMATLRTRHLGWLARALIAKANCWITLSNEITAELLAEGFDRGSIVAIPNGVDLSVYSSAAATAGGWTGPAVVAVGRLSREKGFDILIRSWPEVVETIPDARLLLVGDGPEGSSLQELAHKVGVSERITFVGDSLEVPSYLAAAEVFVLPSRHEGLANALLEAMAAGRPCLASDIVPNAAVIQPGVNGLLFRDGDSHDLALQLRQLLADGSLRARLAEEARRTVASDYGIDRVARQYVLLYRALQSNGLVAQKLAIEIQDG